MGRLKEKEHFDKYQDYTYPKLKKIDGSHPLKKVTDEAFIEYEVRKRAGGKVAFFNFELAKEMGLIPKDHAETLSNHFKDIILDTFSLVIINEYDKLNKIKYSPSDVKKNKYMATRYLQLQHPNKQGKTSGDGRSIWNGQVTHQNKSWDISSCGTGATRLSPATHINKKYFQTGDPSISYGCGYSEFDEGLSSLFFSEVLKKNKVKTEQILAIIEFEKGLAINIRAHQNLLRPSHFFNHLKQGSLEALKSMTDYYIEIESRNCNWKNVPSAGKKRYLYLLDRLTETFAKMAAVFEDEYIFCWLDWDGDNILMDGSIIDYGSVRQFGLFHSEYRYDDVQRYSTSIVEQKRKARYIVQAFAQMIDFIITKNKKNIKEFKNHPGLKRFDKEFEECKNWNLLYKMGFNEKSQRYLFENHKKEVTAFRQSFRYFERAKSHEGVYEVADGINWNAIFCMRDILRELPQFYLSRDEKITDDEFIQVIKSSYAKKKDLELSNYRKKMIECFQNDYWSLLALVAKKLRLKKQQVLLEICPRSCLINKYDRVTGDSITTIVDKVSKKRPRFGAEEIYQVMRDFSEYQNLNPENAKARNYFGKEHSSFLRSLFKIVREYREGL